MAFLKVLEGTLYIGKNHSKYFHAYLYFHANIFSATWFIHEYLDINCMITLRMDPGLEFIQRVETNIVMY